MKRLLLVIAIVAVPGLLLSLLAFNRIKDARPAEAVALTGRITSFDHHYHGSRGCFECIVPPYDWDAYNVSLKLTDGVSAGPFWLHTGEFQPPLPDALKQPGALATIWYDRGTSDLIGLAVGGQRYATEYLAHPRAKYWDAVSLGLFLVVPVALVLLVVLLVAAFTAGQAIRRLLPGPPRRFHLAPIQATGPSDEEAEAYAYLTYAVYLVSAFILVIVASIRWGSMPFWGLVMGCLFSIGVELGVAPLIDRPSRWISGLGLLSLVVLPVGVTAVLAFSLTYVEHHL